MKTSTWGIFEIRGNGELMNQFRFVDNTTPPDPKVTPLDVPVRSLTERCIGDLKLFGRLFREEVTNVMRRQGGLFHRSPYADLTPQHGSFDRLMEVVEHYHYRLIDVTRCDDARNEFLCRVQMRIPVLPQFYDQLFTKGVPEGSKGFVLVSFMMGVGREFTRLTKEAAPEPIHLVAEPTEPETLDDAFNPDKVISGALKHLRADRRFPYVAIGEEQLQQHYYQTVEGFFYRVEIEGYGTAES
jgi:hypothetical protein